MATRRKYLRGYPQLLHGLFDLAGGTSPAFKILLFDVVSQDQTGLVGNDIFPENNLGTSFEFFIMIIQADGLQQSLG